MESLRNTGPWRISVMSPVPRPWDRQRGRTANTRCDSGARDNLLDAKESCQERKDSCSRSLSSHGYLEPSHWCHSPTAGLSREVRVSRRLQHGQRGGLGFVCWAGPNGATEEGSQSLTLASRTLVSPKLARHMILVARCNTMVVPAQV